MNLKKDLEQIELGTEAILRFFLLFWIFFGILAFLSSYLFGTTPSKIFSVEKFSNIFWLVASAAMVVIWRELYRVRRLLERVSTRKYNPIYQQAREKLGL